MQSGVYEAKPQLRVYHWPEPDANGTGKPVRDEKRNVVKDYRGRALRHYERPEGFKNLQSSDGTPTHILVDNYGDPVRSPSGHAIEIKPGRVVVLDALNNATYLENDEEVEAFEANHVFVKDHDAADAEDDYDDDDADYSDDELAEHKESLTEE
jgi:hypothetical protein